MTSESTIITGIDPTAVVRGDVEMAEDIAVGPGCVLDGTLGPITIGSGTRLIGGVYLHGPLVLGARNTIYPNACIGFAPQSLDFDPATAGRGVVIGDGNTFREGATVHRAKTAEGPTVIGDRNYFMVNSHAGHDARVADHCTFANGALLGGHVEVGERVVIGGNTCVHQFCRIGRGAMLSGGVALPRDLPPFFMLTGVNIAGSINTVGMRRQGLTSDQTGDIRWVYKTLYRRGLPPSAALEALRERAGRPLVAECIEFIESSRRGLCAGGGQPKRNQGTL